MAHQEVQNAGFEKVGSEVAFTVVKPQLIMETLKANNVMRFYKAAFGVVETSKAAFGVMETSRTTHSKRKAEQEILHMVFN